MTIEPRDLILTFAILLLAIFFSPARAQDNPADSVGPMVGHVDQSSAQLLFRYGPVKQTLRLVVFDKTQQVAGQDTVETRLEDDYVAKFTLTGLAPNAEYRYRISRIDAATETMLADGSELTFKTTHDLAAEASRQKTKATICFVSCVDIEENPLWAGIERLDPDLLCLMGDTPYIDSSDRAVARQRHRDFLNVPGLKRLIRNTPTVGVWDDHDFGLNNGNGRNMADGKQATRQAFVEYRAHQQYGTGTEGVYHNVDLGPIEVFLLDPRYFSQTEPSPVDPQQPTCFGKQQWTWLLKKLKASRAPFKVLSMGAIWQDKKNAETDDMFTYWYERDALFDFIKKENIGGVVLLGGDIHVSRHLVHRQRLGYHLHDFVISPGHARTITKLDVYHPSLEWSLVEGNQFLSLSADCSGKEPELNVTFRQATDIVNRKVVIPLSKLTAKPDAGLRQDLRAHWSFDKDFSNSSRQGIGLDAHAESGTAATLQVGRFGQAASFQRQNNQFLSVPRNPLDDNSDQHTLALWFKPDSLPQHGTDQRQFLLESTAEGKPSDASAWHLSVGLRGATDPKQVRLQLYTHTLQKASGPEQAPAARSQGGFDFLVPRAALMKWNHVAVVYNSTQLALYLNGEVAKTFPLRFPGPASEFGGMIFGGHRAGEGRNFDGLIDDIAVWSRCLTGEEIRLLATSPVSSNE